MPCIRCGWVLNWVDSILCGFVGEDISCSGFPVQNPKDKFIGNPGGQSWTVDWLKFDNSYFKVSKSW
jgi:hypothetical protein